MADLQEFIADVMYTGSDVCTNHTPGAEETKAMIVALESCWSDMNIVFTFQKYVFL